MLSAIPQGAVWRAQPIVLAPTRRKPSHPKPQDDDCTAIEDKGDDGHHDTLENYLSREVGERYRRDMEPAQCEINGGINYQ